MHPIPFISQVNQITDIFFSLNDFISASASVSVSHRLSLDFATTLTAMQLDRNAANDEQVDIPGIVGLFLKKFIWLRLSSNSADCPIDREKICVPNDNFEKGKNNQTVQEMRTAQFDNFWNLTF
jgi:hypothetical protein